MSTIEKIEKLESKILILTESRNHVLDKLKTLKSFYNYLQVREWRKYSKKLLLKIKYNESALAKLKDQVLKEQIAKTARLNAKEVLRES